MAFHRCSDSHLLCEIRLVAGRGYSFYRYFATKLDGMIANIDHLFFSYYLYLYLISRRQYFRQRLSQSRRTISTLKTIIHTTNKYCRPRFRFPFVHLAILTVQYDHIVDNRVVLKSIKTSEWTWKEGNIITIEAMINSELVSRSHVSCTDTD